MTGWRQEFYLGAVPDGHLVASCSECEGRGGFYIEPPYDFEVCGSCSEGRVEEIECSVCAAPLDPDVGVGMVEQRIGTPHWFAYCGPCAWAEVVDDSGP